MSSQLGRQFLVEETIICSVLVVTMDLSLKLGFQLPTHLKLADFFVLHSPDVLSSSR